MKKKVAIIGTNGIPSKYGGFETLAEYLSKYLSEDYEVIVYCSKTPKEKQLKSYNNSRLIYLPFRANGWQSMIYDAISIVHAFFISDVLIILGFSGIAAFPLRIFFRKKKIIFNIGGIEWQKVRGAKLLGKLEVAVKKWFEKVCVYFSDSIVVDNQVLFDYVNDTYNRKAYLIEYGGDHAIFENSTDELILKYPFLTGSYDLTISRAQEDMNIHIVLSAYEKSPNRNIVIISNWQISEYGINLKKKYLNQFPNIILLDAIYNLKELNAIRSNCSLYIHTHSLCGTAPSLTEAMSLKLPVISFDVPTNRASTENKTLYFKSWEELEVLLGKMSNDEIKGIRDELYEIANRRYTWRRIVGLYKKTIEENE